MKIYFLSSIPAALYVGGAYFGRVSQFERFARLSLQDRLPIRFEAEGMFPITFFADEQLPLSPPMNVDIFRLDDGLAVYAHGFTAADTSLCILAQARQAGTLATVSKQGAITLAIESPDGFFNATLPPTFVHCELFFWKTLIVVKSGESLLIFNQKAEKLLDERGFDTHFQEDTLTINLRLSDRYNRTAECTYLLQNETLQKVGHQIRQGEDVGSDGLLAYAFFEAVRIGADVTPFLCDELQEKADSVCEFLGGFLEVLPTENPNECLLVYKKAERLFDVRRFRVTVQGEKITDVSG